MSLELSIGQTFNRCKPLCMLAKGLLVYCRGKLFLYDIDVGTFDEIGMLSNSRIEANFTKIRAVERALRLEPRIAIPIDNNKALVSTNAGIFSVDVVQKIIKMEHHFQKNIRCPLSFGKIKGVDGFEECLVYGEYFSNQCKNAVSIYARKLLSSDWTKIYEFSPGIINHIHSVLPDFYRNQVLILTGDQDEGSGFWVAKDNFHDVKPLLVGRQGYRACCAYSLPEGILFATDTPLQDNYICLALPDGNTWNVNIIANLNGPCIFSTMVGDQFVFATSVEPDSNIAGYKYLFTTKLGNGVKSRNSHIVAGTLYSGFKTIAQFKKDFLPMGFFQFGNIQFPSGNNKDLLIMYPIGLKKYDGKMLITKLNNQ